MALIGYARVSTVDQKLDSQIQQLRDVKVDKIFEEKASGADSKRPQLSSMLDYVRDGDTVIVCKLDRIARSTRHLLDIIHQLEQKSVAFRVLNINLDTSSPTGKLMLTMLGAIATFEREMMLERQQEGIARAKASGVYKGRKATARAKATEVIALLEQKKTKQTIASTLGIGIASVYRIARAHKVDVPL